MNQTIKRTLVIISFCHVLALCSKAQDAAPEAFTIPRTLIKIAPLHYFTSTLKLGIESFNPTYSKSFEVSVGLRSGFTDFSRGNGGLLEIGYRKYVSPMKLNTRKQRVFYQGIYYSLFINGSYFNGKDYDYSYYDPNTGVYTSQTSREEIFSVGPGFTLGLQKTLWKVIFLDVYFGGGIRFTDVNRSGNLQYDRHYDITDPGHEGIYPKIGANIGIGL